jgi:hypothetical protein
MMPFIEPDGEIGITVRFGIQREIESVIYQYFPDYGQSQSLAVLFCAEERREDIFLNLVGYAFAVISYGQSSGGRIFHVNIYLSVIVDRFN